MVKGPNHHRLGRLSLPAVSDLCQSRGGKHVLRTSVIRARLLESLVGGDLSVGLHVLPTTMHLMGRGHHSPGSSVNKIDQTRQLESENTTQSIHTCHALVSVIANERKLIPYDPNCRGDSNAVIVSTRNTLESSSPSLPISLKHTKAEGAHERGGGIDTHQQKPAHQIFRGPIPRPLLSAP